MDRFRYLLWLFVLLPVVACSRGPETPAEVVEVTRLVMPETPVAREVTRLVRITPIGTPVAGGREEPATPESPSPLRLRNAVAQEPLTVDPALATDPASLALVQNVVEPLLYPDPRQPGSFLPLLATHWEISEDERTYVFNIRPDVTFTDGSVLTASDMAYSIQRALLLSEPGGPQGRLLEPLLGYASGDITEEIGNGIYRGDAEGLIANATERDLLAVCEKVKAAVVADDRAGTLTFNLVQPWGPFLATLSQPWTGAIDRDWALRAGAWNNSCEAWQNWYAPGVANSALATNIMGTGPYLLDHWTPALAYVLVANPGYWRHEDEPLWDAPEAPRGTPAIRSVEVQFVPDDAARLALLQQAVVDMAEITPPLRILADAWSGEICSADTPADCVATEATPGPLRKLAPLPAEQRTDILFNFDIATDENFFIGSGVFDGEGIPPDFFSDLNVRRGFSYCIDTGQFVSQAYHGLGIPNPGVIPPTILGHDPAGEIRTLDLDRCATELAAAWGGQLPEAGFRLQAPFVTGDRVQEAALNSLQDNLSLVNPNYRLETVGLPSHLYAEGLQAGRLPLIFLTWRETVHDPHNWAAAYLASNYNDYQALPAELQAELSELVSAGATTTGLEERLQVYAELDRVRAGAVPHIILPQPANVQYQQRWITGWLVNPAVPGPYYYAYRLQ